MNDEAHEHRDEESPTGETAQIAPLEDAVHTAPLEDVPGEAGPGSERGPGESTPASSGEGAASIAVDAPVAVLGGAGADGARFALGAGEPARPGQPVAADTTEAERPRTRWAAIIWGTVLAVAAACGLWAATSRERLAGIRDALIGALLELNPVTSTVLVLLVVGVLILIIGMTGLARRLQRRLAARA